MQAKTGNFSTQCLDWTIEFLTVEASSLVGNSLKQTTWHPQRINLFHFYTETHQEVDIILEHESGKIVGVEVKSSETVGIEDFKHFKIMKEAVGDDFLRGIVLYAGHQILHFGPDLLALPISTLWN